MSSPSNTRRASYLVLSCVFAYFAIAVIDALVTGHVSWRTYLLPAIGAGIGIYVAARTKRPAL